MAERNLSSSVPTPSRGPYASFQTAASDLLSAEDKKFFHANLASDIDEKTSLAPQHPEIVERLSKLRAEWLAIQKEPATESTPWQDVKDNES